jgi:hypothetical protein
MYSHSFLQKQIRLHSAYYCSGRSALSGRIPATHPYYDTFVNIKDVEEELQKSKLTFASSNWKGITDKIRKIDIPAKRLYRTNFGISEFDPPLLICSRDWRSPK